MKRSLARWAVLPLVAAFIVILDQWSKNLIRINLPEGGSFAPFPALASYFNLVHWTNTGAAFGLLRGQSGLFVFIAVVVIIVVLVYTRQLPVENWMLRLCLGIQLGGTAGNLLDRLQFSGRVTDFLLFTVPIGGKIYAWPAFNVADSSIVVSVILLGMILFRLEDSKPGGRASETKSAPTQG